MLVNLLNYPVSLLKCTFPGSIPRDPGIQFWGIQFKNLELFLPMIFSLGWNFEECCSMYFLEEYPCISYKFYFHTDYYFQEKSLSSLKSLAYPLQSHLHHLFFQYIISVTHRCKRNQRCLIQTKLPQIALRTDEMQINEISVNACFFPN